MPANQKVMVYQSTELRTTPTIIQYRVAARIADSDRNEDNCINPVKYRFTTVTAQSQGTNLYRELQFKKSTIMSIPLSCFIFI